MPLIAFPTTGYNTYATNAEADEHFALDVRNSDWIAKTEYQQDQSLVTAFRMLERLRPVGAKVDADQEGLWPRTGVYYPDGTAVPDDTLPADWITAQYELALALALKPTIATSSSTASNIKRVRGGPAEVEFFAPVAAAASTPLPWLVWELLFPYLLASQGVVGLPVLGDPDYVPPDLDFTPGSPFY